MGTEVQVDKGHSAGSEAHLSVGSTVQAAQGVLRVAEIDALGCGCRICTAIARKVVEMAAVGIWGDESEQLLCIVLLHAPSEAFGLHLCPSLQPYPNQ